MSKSVMQHQFSQIPKSNIQRSSFDRSHGLKTTFDGGKLVPIFVDEALPADTVNLNMTGFARLATPIHPIMDNMKMETFFFSVPMRLVWDNWQKFCGEQTHPTDSTDYVIPNWTGVPTQGGIFDYMGLPTGKSVNFSVLPIRALFLIWDEWFRDQNLQQSYDIVKDDSGSTYANITAYPNSEELPVRGKRHDYFTSALPWPQKGDSVPLPLGDSAPVSGIGFAFPVAGSVGGTSLEDSSGLNSYSHQLVTNATTHHDVIYRMTGAGASELPVIQAELGNATASTINQLRQAFQIQKMMEKDARGGTRYTEIVRSHFGVLSPDARLQRPEYLGGGSSYVNINPVAQTAATDVTSPQGNLAATGTVTLNGHGFTKSFTEHCIIIGLVNVRADLTYQQGLERMWSRRTRYDFYWPSLAHIGEQAILNKEIFAQGTAADEEVFGYQERYAEYRYKQSKITGLFRSNATGSLDAWHLSQDFAALPALGADFIQDNPPIDRVIAVPSEPHFIFDSYFKSRWVRPMPMYGVPGLIDHF